MLTVEALREVLSYSPETGVFTWLKSTSNRSPVGSVAGHRAKNLYIQIRVFGKLYQAHRLAIFYMTGAWPAELVDHRELDRADNRFTSIRAATHTENACNTPRRKDNISGFKGVGLHKQTGRYRARIRHKGRTIALGLYETAEGAHRAYVEASTEMHREFGRV